MKRKEKMRFVAKEEEEILERGSNRDLFALVVCAHTNAKIS
jgi:hypothetical protein